MVYAAVLAHGTSMSAADIARMVPELSATAIRQMMSRIADERMLRQAADAVLEFMHRHSIAQHWGRADLASSDMMSLETTRTVWQARADPRRRTSSIGVYTHVRDRWGIFYDQPIVLNERQAGVAIEGVIRQSSTDDVAMLAVDTHGFVVTWTLSSFRHANEAYSKQQDDRLAGRSAQGVARSGPASRVTCSTDSPCSGGQGIRRRYAVNGRDPTGFLKGDSHGRSQRTSARRAEKCRAIE